MKITWTKVATTSYDNYLYFLNQQWNTEVVNTFRQLLNEKIKILTAYPKSGAVFYNSKRIRRLVIHRNTSIYYKLLSDEILILLIWDNRADPQELLQILEDK